MGAGLLKHTMAVAAISSSILPHTYLLDRYRKLRTRYSFDNVEIPVRKDIQKRFEEVIDDIGLAEKDKQNIKLFNVYDINVFHAGSTFTKYGAVVGVPINFEYKNSESITEETISFQGRHIDWTTKAASEFRKSLILSESAQKFAMAQKVLKVAYPELWAKAGIVLMDVTMVVLIYNIICTRFLVRKRSLQYFYLGLCSIGCYILWLTTSTLVEQERDSEINAQLVSLGPKYIQGGIEYYEKLLNRNKALRTLLGERGTYLFTSSGDEISWSRRTVIPISKQIDYFKSKMLNAEQM